MSIALLSHFIRKAVKTVGTYKYISYDEREYTCGIDKKQNQISKRKSMILGQTLER